MTTMKTPDFFDKVPPIVIADPLAEFLGATEGGLLEYRYVDAVKLAGHSCPTVAGAWLMTRLRTSTPKGRRSEEGFGSICTSGRMKAWPE